MRITTLHSFNTAPPLAARDLLLACAAVPRWADEVVAGRPYADLDAAVQTARTAAAPWTDAEVDAALERHPRIGERASDGTPDAAHSRREQSAVDTADATTTHRLAAGNRAYEEKFGHVFLIRAAGRSGADILAALDQRLTNDPATERRIVADELREIAVLRLQELS